MMGENPTAVVAKAIENPDAGGSFRRSLGPLQFAVEKGLDALPAIAAVCVVGLGTTAADEAAWFM